MKFQSPGLINPMEVASCLRELEQLSGTNGDVFKELRRGIHSNQQAVLPSNVFELCRASGRTMSGYMSNPDVIAKLAPDLKPVVLADVDALHLKIPRLSDRCCDNTEVSVYELIDRMYATVNIGLSGFDALLRVTLDSKNPSLRYNALAGLVQHFSDESDLLLLALTQLTDPDLIAVSQSILPYANPTYSGLQAERLLTQPTPLSLPQSQFVLEATTMWWNYSGKNHFDAADDSTITNDEFLKKFEIFTQETFPRKAHVLALATLIGDILSDDMTKKGTQLTELAKIDLRLSESILSMAVRRPSTEMQVFCLEKLNEISPGVARFEASRIKDSAVADDVRKIVEIILQ